MIQPVDNWRRMYKMASVWVFMAIAVISALAGALPQMADYLEPQQLAWLTMTLALAGIGARAIKQGLDEMDPGADKPP